MDEAKKVRIGLGYVRGVREHEIRKLAGAREEGGRFRNLSDLASRAGAGSPSLELLAWSGACDSLVPDDGVDTALGHSSARRIALWQLGVATPGRNVPGGTQLALPLDLPAPPKLRDLSGWETMLADYGTTGLTVDRHPMALLRNRMPAGSVTSRGLEVLEHGSRVRIGGLVVARQRPGTANGIVFILLEDEFGTINLIIPAELYERNRLIVRTEPLMLVEGKLERFAAAGGAINVLVSRVGSIAAPDRMVAEIKDFSMLDEQVRRAREAERGGSVGARGGPWTGAAAAETAGEEGSADAEDFRVVAPPVMSFASGRRR
jgi:error-prone DNA polymerase